LRGKGIGNLSNDRFRPGADVAIVPLNYCFSAKTDTRALLNLRFVLMETVAAHADQGASSADAWNWEEDSDSDGDQQQELLASVAVAGDANGDGGVSRRPCARPGK